MHKTLALIGGIALGLQLLTGCANNSSKSDTVTIDSVVEAPRIDPTITSAYLVGSWTMDSIIFNYGPDSNILLVPTSSELKLNADSTGTGDLKGIVRGTPISSLTTIPEWYILGDSIHVTWKYQDGEIEKNVYGRTLNEARRQRWIDASPGVGGKREILILTRK